MIKNSFLIILFFSSTLGFTQDLIPYRVGDKWGFANDKGNLIIEADYDSVGLFQPNTLMQKHISIVKRNGKLNLIDSDNNIILDEGLKIKSFQLTSNFLIVEQEDQKIRFYDSTNNGVHPLIVDAVQKEKNGLLSVELNGKVGLIDHNLNTVIPIEYDLIYCDWLHSYIKEEEMNVLRTHFDVSSINHQLYIDGKLVNDNIHMLIATVINDQETKKVFLNYDSRKYSNFELEATFEDDEEIEETVIESTVSYDDDVTVEEVPVTTNSSKITELESRYDYVDCNRDETISSAIGKNKQRNTLTILGVLMDKILDIIDPNHSLNSIDYHVEPPEDL